MNLSHFSFQFVHHRNQEVILCKFKYDHEILTRFRKAFPSAKWSKTHTSWYVPDTNLFRKRFGLELHPIGHLFEKKIHKVNVNSFIKFRDVLTLKGYAINTIESYVSEFAQFLIHLRNVPVSSINAEKINAYNLHCIQIVKQSENQVHSRINAIKAYFKWVENKTVDLDIVRPKKPKQLPKVLSKAEIKKLFTVIENPKHAMMLKLIYGMGLRVSEMVNLKVSDIDSSRMQVRIEQSKGKKDRYVHLPESILIELRSYYKTYKPKVYLLEGQFSEKYTCRSIQAVFKRAMKKAKINKEIGVHGLRHSYATHLLEAGTDMVFIQKLLGHSHIKTTEIYAKVTTKIISKVQSPLDTI